ncbi:MAG: hypothetical protein ACKPJD_13150 [Planctomycetaceae bacterium]
MRYRVWWYGGGSLIRLEEIAERDVQFWVAAGGLTAGLILGRG